MTDQEIEDAIHEIHPDIKVGGFELLVGRLIALREREKCAKIAEIPHMTPADIARVIRNG
jgi:hypothetical protein